MASPASQRRANTRRALAAQRAGHRAIPELQNVRIAIIQSQVDQGYRWLNGTDPMPKQGTPEARLAARLASLSSRGKLDARFEAAFSIYWYHDDSPEPEPDEDE